MALKLPARPPALPACLCRRRAWLRWSWRTGQRCRRSCAAASTAALSRCGTHGLMRDRQAGMGKSPLVCEGTGVKAAPPTGGRGTTTPKCVPTCPAGADVASRHFMSSRQPSKTRVSACQLVQPTLCRVSNSKLGGAGDMKPAEKRSSPNCITPPPTRAGAERAAPWQEIAGDRRRLHFL
jgi:hypothetical protein